MVYHSQRHKQNILRGILIAGSSFVVAFCAKVGFNAVSERINSFELNFRHMKHCVRASISKIRVVYRTLKVSFFIAIFYVSYCIEFLTFCLTS